jgi:hypothetical protein
MQIQSVDGVAELESDETSVLRDPQITVKPTAGGATGTGSLFFKPLAEGTLDYEPVLNADGQPYTFSLSAQKTLQPLKGSFLAIKVESDNAPADSFILSVVV